jgi:hypothetical protein
MITQKQVEKMASLVKKIKVAIEDAEKYANETGQHFSLNIEYGMGGTYYPPLTQKQKDKMEEAGEWYSSDGEGWQSSSSRC